MDIAVLGTGSVGRALAARFAALGHTVLMGTRDPEATEAREDFTLPEGVRLTGFAEAAAGAALVVNATNGSASLEVLERAGADHLAGKVLLDAANPLDFSAGFPPTLSVKDTDSLAEQIQRAHPAARVVKALNTMNAAVMVDPGSVAGGDHTTFVAGNDAGAKETVVALLRELGHRDVLDLGDLSAARGMEMYLPLWLRLMQTTGGAAFQVKVQR